MLYARCGAVHYWTEHFDIKDKLESEKNALRTEIDKIKEQIAPYDCKIADLKKERDETITPSNKEKINIENKIKSLREQLSNLGLFKNKQKIITGSD